SLVKTGLTSRARNSRELAKASANRRSVAVVGPIPEGSCKSNRAFAYRRATAVWATVSNRLAGGGSRWQAYSKEALPRTNAQCCQAATPDSVSAALGF